MTLQQVREILGVSPGPRSGNDLRMFRRWSEANIEKWECWQTDEMIINVALDQNMRVVRKEVHSFRPRPPSDMVEKLQRDVRWLRNQLPF